MLKILTFYCMMQQKKSLDRNSFRNFCLRRPSAVNRHYDVFFSCTVHILYKKLRNILYSLANQNVVFFRANDICTLFSLYIFSNSLYKSNMVDCLQPFAICLLHHFVQQADVLLVYPWKRFVHYKLYNLNEKWAHL